MKSHIHFIFLLLSLIPLTNCATKGPVNQKTNRQISSTNNLLIDNYLQGLSNPWSLNFSTDGKLFFTQRDSGEVFVYDTNLKNLQKILTVKNLRVEGEAGLLGMKLDYHFSNNSFVYLCYSSWSENIPVNKISRFTFNGDKLLDEKLLIQTPGSILHNGCRLEVDKDDNLFISMGENFKAERSQDLKSLNGKILRIKTNGEIPTDNPFKNSAVWSYGHRNPQGLAIDKQTGLLWSTEHGPENNDELNLILKGRNYGWPYCRGESKCFRDYVPAVKSYYPQETIAISNLIFYYGNQFPVWNSQALFVTLKTGRLYRVKLDGNKFVEDEILIDGNFGRLRDLAIGNDGLIYVATIDSIIRISPK